MLSPAFMMMQIARWEKRTGPETARAAYEEAVEIPCWAELLLDCSGPKGRVFLPAGRDVRPGDRITLDGEACFIKSVLRLPTHLECELA